MRKLANPPPKETMAGVGGLWINHAMVFHPKSKRTGSSRVHLIVFLFYIFRLAEILVLKNTSGNRTF